MTPGFTHAVILDFEATCDDARPPRPQEVIEFPSVLLALDSLQIVDEFEAFVRPQHHPRLTEFCRHFTAITQADVDAAAPFGEVFARHQGWLAGHGLDAERAVIVTCGDWDLGVMLPVQCPVAEPPVESIPPLYRRWHNLKRSYAAVSGTGKAPGMAGMLTGMDLPLTGHHHRGIDDCRNLAALWRALVERGARLQAEGCLPPGKHPPITLDLRLAGQVERVRLPTRSLDALGSLVGKTFHRRAGAFVRADGRLLERDDELLDLVPGEVLDVREATSERPQPLR